MRFDKPASLLDPELVGEFLRVMRTVAEEGRARIMVTHAMGLERKFSNKVVFLHKGQIEGLSATRFTCVPPVTPP